MRKGHKIVEKGTRDFLGRLSARYKSALSYIGVRFYPVPFSPDPTLGKIARRHHTDAQGYPRTAPFAGAPDGYLTSEGEEMLLAEVEGPR